MATTSMDFLRALRDGGIPGRTPGAVAPTPVTPGAIPPTQTASAGPTTGSNVQQQDFVDRVPYTGDPSDALQALKDAALSSAGSGGSGSSGGGGGGHRLRDKGLDFLNPKIEGALNAAILGLLTNGGIVGRGFEDAANLLREEEKASTLRNMGRNAELFNSRNLLGSGPRLEAQTAIGDQGQQNLFAALVELELQRLALQQQGQLGGIGQALGLGQLGLNEFLAALQLASQTVPGGAGPDGTDGEDGSVTPPPRVPPLRGEPTTPTAYIPDFKNGLNPFTRPFDIDYFDR